jgi:type I restriction-modification system DNA methylase subunit
VDSASEAHLSVLLLAEPTRSLGLEDGLDLLLNLIYLRGVTSRDDDERRRYGSPSQWEDFRDELLGSFAPLAVLDAALSARIPFWERQSLRSPRSHDGTALHDVLNAILAQEQFESLASNSSDELFEAVLRHRSASLGRTSGEVETPVEVAQLMARLIATNGRVADPACGIGNTLMEAHRSGASHLTGTDVNPMAAARAQMRFELGGIEADIRVGDTLRDAQQESDGIVLQPPFGMKLSTAQQQDLSDLPFGAPRGPNADAVWLQRAAIGLSYGGHGVALLPLGTLFRGGYDRGVREGLLLNGCVEAVILLPDGLMTSTQIPTCLWLLRPPQAEADRDVLYLDTSTLTVRTRNRSHLTPEGIDKVVEIVEDWRRTGSCTEAPYLARAVSILNIFNADGSLSPERFLEPPPVTIAARPQPASRLLTEVRVGGFKSFGDEQRVPLAPITLIYGPNSSGKSSLIQGLLLLKQSIDADDLVTQGKLVDAGSLVGALHRHETTRVLTLGITYGALDEWHSPDGVPDPALLRSIDTSFKADSVGQARQRDVLYRFGDYAVTFRKGVEDSERAHFETPVADLEALFRGIATGTLQYPFQADGAEPIDSQEWAEQAAKKMTTGTRVIRMLLKARTKNLRVDANGLLAGRVQMPDVFKESSYSREPSIMRTYVGRGFAMTEGIGKEVRSLLKGVVYLGPLRSAPERFHNRTPSQRGQDNNGSHFAIHLFDNSSEVEKVNEWLANLGVPYVLQVVPVGTAGSANIVGDLVAVNLTDMRSGVEVSPADIGFGISQVLPIVVEALARQSSVICVEQPEIHLHPALQSQLADLLIESTAEEGRGNQFLVETHSEHLVLRMQRRIREGSLSADRVNVIYVDQDEDGITRCRRLRLDKNGDFLDPWPHGFFEERLDEILGDWQ